MNRYQHATEGHRSSGRAPVLSQLERLYKAIDACIEARGKTQCREARATYDSIITKHLTKIAQLEARK